jgi:tetratricopeptide (TPR) repeat protein
MTSFVSQSLAALSSAVLVPLLLGLVVGVLIGSMRAASSLRYAIRQRGRRPLVVQVDYAKETQDADKGDTALDARLLSYLAADGRGSYVIAPGAGGPAAPRVPAEAAQPTAALLRLALARERAYRVDVAWPSQAASASGLRATVRITRTPTDRVVASRSFTDDSVDDLVEIIGCYCVAFLRSQPKILRQTPRWERWSSDINGYRAYRRGLDHQGRAEATSSAAEYKAALDCFHLAARIDPANMLVQLHRAALLELDNKHADAVAIYKKCRALWPEHIEIAYRLGNAHKSIQDHVTFAELNIPLQDIRTQLRIRRLLTYWLRSCLPHRWNPGERRYWGSWLRPTLPGAVSKRLTYLNAIAVSELLAELSSLLKRPYDDPSRFRKRLALGDAESGSPGTNAARRVAKRSTSDARNKREFEAMLTELAAIVCPRRPPVGRWRSWHDDGAVGRLMWPDRLSQAADQKHSAADRGSRGSDLGKTPSGDAMSDYSYIPIYHGRRSHHNPGWLTLFNTACFLSLAMDLPAKYIPLSYPGRKLWGDYCARAAIRELGMILRHPEHALDPDWLRTDPDLSPLRDSPIGQEWASFVGLVRRQ